MKLLMISLDKRILDPESSTSKRIREYASLVEKLEVIVLSKEGFLKTVRRGFKFLKSNQSNCLITTQDPFFTGLAGYVLKKLTGTPLQIQIHTDFASPYFRKESLKNFIMYYMARFFIPRADCLRVVSERIKKSVSGRTVVLPIYVDLDAIKQAKARIDLHQKYADHKFIILMASRFTKEKNIELAIQATKEIAKNNPGVLLLIVGSGPLKSKYEKLIGESGNVKMENWTDDINSYYKTSDLFLLTSNYEGYGRTLIEAAAAGCKIVSSDVGISRNIMSAENVFKTGDKEDLIKKIELAISGNIYPADPPHSQSKEEYLAEYKKSWQSCLL